MKRWMEVSLQVPKEFGEAISNFLMEQGAAGIEEIDEDSRLVRLKTYYEQDRRVRRVLRDLRQYLTSLRKLHPEMAGYRIETASIFEQDWAENWKKFFKPVQVGSRFIVKPPWSKIRLRRGQIPIEITPGMAFGTGTHATTKLCIRSLEQRGKRRGLSVLDVGTGSGILSIVAAKLGADEVRGFDIDGVAVEIARENAEKNGVSKIVRMRKGSIGAISKKFDVVVANIDYKSLKRMRRPMLHRLKGQGFLILSGILETETDRLRQNYLETGLLEWVETIEEGEWACLTFRKKKPKLQDPNVK